MKLVAFILSNNSYESIEYTVNKIPIIIDDFFISEDSKDKNILESAYDDSQGTTAKFNLNVLSRINDELDADFNIENFLS